MVTLEIGLVLLNLKTRDDLLKRIICQSFYTKKVKEIYLRTQLETGLTFRQITAQNSRTNYFKNEMRIYKFSNRIVLFFHFHFYYAHTDVYHM